MCVFVCLCRAVCETFSIIWTLSEEERRERLTLHGNPGNTLKKITPSTKDSIATQEDEKASIPDIISHVEYVFPPLQSND